MSLAWALVGAFLAEGQWLERCDGGSAGFRGDRRRRHFVFQIPLGYQESVPSNDGAAEVRWRCLVPAGRGCTRGGGVGGVVDVVGVAMCPGYG